MRKESQAEFATMRAIRERIQELHAHGQEAHTRFIAAHARQDREGMAAAASEHTAINAEASKLLDMMRARLIHERQQRRHVR
jgi:hypothetical protein